MAEEQYKFYAEYRRRNGDIEIEPIWAPDGDTAQKHAKSRALGTQSEFIRIDENWDAFKDANGNIMPYHVLTAPEGGIKIGDRVLYRTGDKPLRLVTVTGIFLDIAGWDYFYRSTSWLVMRIKGKADLNNGVRAYGWQIEPVHLGVIEGDGNEGNTG